MLTIFLIFLFGIFGNYFLWNEQQGISKFVLMVVFSSDLGMLVVGLVTYILLLLIFE